MKRIIFVAALLPALAACDQLKERMGMHDPAKAEAEGKAVGSGCRHAGRGLEDCYRLNPDSDKAAIFAGWKEMNEYMLKNNMQSVPPQGQTAEPGEAAKESQKEAAEKKTEAKPETKPETKLETPGKPAGGH